MPAAAYSAAIRSRPRGRTTIAERLKPWIAIVVLARTPFAVSPVWTKPDPKRSIEIDVVLKPLRGDEELRFPQPKAEGRVLQ